MTKLFLIITAAALLATAVFGWQNRSALVADRTARLANNKQMDNIINEFVDPKVGELETAHADLYAAEKLLAQHEADLSETKDKIATIDTEIGTLKGEMAPLDAEIATAESTVEELRSRFPGINLDNIGEKIKQLQSDLEDSKQELAAKQAEVEIVTKQVAANGKSIERAQKRAAERLARIRGNATEGTITAVNTDWGFAVANVGSGAGIGDESILIVKRGAQRIARLEVVSVQPGKTVLDIRQKSLTGLVQPGDRVIFEKPLE